MTGHERLYRALLRAYPRTTREASGDDMAQLFADRLRDASSRAEKGRLWAEVVADVVRTAPREHLARRPTAATVEGLTHDPREQLASDVVFSGWPIVVAVLLAVVRPGILDPMFDDRVAIAGLPGGIGILSATAVFAAGGLLAARHSKTLADPGVQLFLLGLVLVPVPTLALVTGAVGEVAAYAIAVTVLVNLLRFRLLMLALVIPFVLCLLVGPAVLRVVIGLGGGPGV